MTPFEAISKLKEQMSKSIIGQKTYRQNYPGTTRRRQHVTRRITWISKNKSN